MKDALGHGSNPRGAHSVGVTAVGLPSSNPIIPRRVPPPKAVVPTAPGLWYHGSPSGELRGSASGLHLGTKEAATQALQARIGIPADGKGWDGTREYGKTLLAGTDTLEKMGPYLKSGYNADAPKNDYYATERKDRADYSDKSAVAFDAKPSVAAYQIVGKMTNKTYTPYEDFKANGYMKASISRGNAKSGFFYKNIGEDSGSISAVVPSASHVRRVA